MTQSTRLSRWYDLRTKYKPDHHRAVMPCEGQNPSWSVLRYHLTCNTVPVLWCGAIPRFVQISRQEAED
jgi:hypothetical protein